MTADEYKAHFKLPDGVEVAAIGQVLLNRSGQPPATPYAVKSYDEEGGLELPPNPPIPQGPIGENAGEIWLTDLDGNAVALPEGSHVTLRNSGKRVNGMYDPSTELEYSVTEAGRIQPWGADQ